MKSKNITTPIFFSVPFVSQHSHFKSSDWKYRGCGIAALVAVINYWHKISSTNKNAEPETLLQDAIKQGAYRENIGWSHNGLAKLATSYGYESFNLDLAPQSKTPMSAEESFNQLLIHIKSGPVIASMFPKMDNTKIGGHLIVVTGWDGIMISFNDPEELDKASGEKRVSYEKFILAFKQRFIVVKPKI